MQPQNQLLIEQYSWIYKICLQQVCIHDISSLPARLCPPKKEVTDHVQDFQGLRDFCGSYDHIVQICGQLIEDQLNSTKKKCYDVGSSVRRFRTTKKYPLQKQFLNDSEPHIGATSHLDIPLDLEWASSRKKLGVIDVCMPLENVSQNFRLFGPQAKEH